MQYRIYNMNNIDLSQHMHKVYNSLPVSIIEADEKMIIQFANQYSKIMFGYDDNELIGSNVTILMTDDVKSMHSTYVNKYLDTGEAHIIGKKGRRIFGKHKDGSILKLILCIDDSIVDGKRVFTASFENLTLLIEEKNTQIKNLYEFEKQKIQFVKRISCPASNIIAMCKTMDCDELPVHLKKLVNDCLEYAQQFTLLSEVFLSSSL
jgi:PAS domain S-box-containing protein